MTDRTYSHLVYWTIPQLDANGTTVCERHYAVNLSEIDPADADTIEAMLQSYSMPFGGAVTGGNLLRTDPKITQYRHLFRPFIEVKKRAQGLCRCSTVWLPYVYAEYADGKPEVAGMRHPAMNRLADSA